jgi:NodT family efflux transporter outer membrane factor (OMF) lipoprotein
MRTRVIDRSSLRRKVLKRRGTVASGAGLALIVLALGGCATAPPRYERPVAPVAERFAGASSAEGTTPTAAQLGWRDFFTDTTLQTLVDTALAGNRDLRIAALSVEQAIAQLGLREADRVPTVGIGIAGSSAQQPTGTTLRSVNSGVQFSAWEIDFFGRLARLSDAARAQVLASEESSRAARISLIAAVASAWLNLIADEELIALTDQTLETRLESLRLTRLRFDNGAASELDFRLAQSLTEGARAVRAQQERQRSLNRNALGLLIGSPGAAPPSLAAARLADIAFTPIPAGLPSELLTSRPDIRAAEQQLIAANANIAAARAAFLPRINLTAAFGSVSRDLAGLFAGGSWGFTAAPSLLQPIFDGGRNEANLKATRAARDIALAQYERAIQTAFREVADALAGRSTLVDQLKAQSGVAEAESARLELARLRYENGISSYLDLLDAQRSLFAARQAVIQTRLQLLQNQVLLYRALGGGWRERS